MFMHPANIFMNAYKMLLKSNVIIGLLMAVVLIKTIPPTFGNEAGLTVNKNENTVSMHDFINTYEGAVLGFQIGISTVIAASLASYYYRPDFIMELVHLAWEIALTLERESIEQGSSPSEVRAATYFALGGTYYCGIIVLITVTTVTGGVIGFILDIIFVVEAPFLKYQELLEKKNDYNCVR